MKVKKELESYIPLLKFIGKAVNEECEVVLYDMSRSRGRAVAVQNGHVSGIGVGDPVPVSLRNLLKGRTDRYQSSWIDYEGKGEGQNLRSSALLIGDAEKPLGILCINIDIADAVRARRYLDGIIGRGHEGHYDSERDGRALRREGKSLEEVILSIIEETLRKRGVPAERMTAQEKIKVVQELSEKGLFKFKGAVGVVAEKLSSSEATIYRYLSKIAMGRDKFHF